MTAEGYIYHMEDGNYAPSATVTNEKAEAKILAFNPERRLRELDQKLGRISNQAFNLKLAA